MSCTSTGVWTAPWLPSTSTGMPRSWAMRQTSFTGTTVPSTFDMWVIATIFVRGVSSFSNSSMRKLPSSATGAHLITAPRFSRRKFHGTMLEWCSMMESTISSPSPIAEPPKEAAARLIASVALRVKIDLVEMGGVDEAADDLARLLVFLGGEVREVVQAAMDVGVFGAVGLGDGVDDRLRLLGRGGIVEIDQRLVVDGARQNREIPAHRLDVERYRRSSRAGSRRRPSPLLQPGADHALERAGHRLVLRACRWRRRGRPRSAAARPRHAARRAPSDRRAGSRRCGPRWSRGRTGRRRRRSPAPAWRRTAPRPTAAAPAPSSCRRSSGRPDRRRCGPGRRPGRRRRRRS